jgi:hypothetical protein
VGSDEHGALWRDLRSRSEGYSLTKAISKGLKVKITKATTTRSELVKAGELDLVRDLAADPKLPTPIQRRLIDGLWNASDEPKNVLFQHTVLCQTCIPSRDPGDEVRMWERLNGGIHMKILAGDAMHPQKGRLIDVGLPFGPKARLILMHINQQALIQKTPEIDIEDTLTRFVQRTLKLAPHGRNMRIVKDQLSRLSAASIRIGFMNGKDEAVTVNSQIISAFNVWLHKDDNQRVLWPSTIRLSLDYFESLKAHAVPLDEDHIARLSHSAMALDIYSWLAQRLHRIPANKPIKISWVALHGQFGQGYTGEQAIKKFRSVFRVALKQVLMLYQEARVIDVVSRVSRIEARTGRPVWRDPPAEGLILQNSPPPVQPRLITNGCG